MVVPDRLRGFFASRRAVAAFALVCIALMLISVNIIAGRLFAWRLDLTSEHLYTLSRGTLRTLARIEEPITLRFYYSTRLADEVPSYGVYAQRVRELLDQYVAAAQRKIRLEVYNPLPFSDVEDRAVAFGLQGVPLDVAGEQVYFGLAATNSTDDQQVIAFFQPERERFLEYDLTKLVHSLAFPKKTVVGLISTLPLEGDMMAMMRGRPAEPMAIMEQLQQLDTVKPLAANIDAIPPDVDVLMLVHPQNLSDKTLFAIDQFVLKGGKALVFVDPLSELQASHPSQVNPPGSPTASNLERLFKSWGFEVPANTVAGDRRDAQRVGVPGSRGGTRPLDYIAWLNLKTDNLNRTDMITADLSHVMMASSGIIEPIAGAKTTIEPLITTSPELDEDSGRKAHWPARCRRPPRRVQTGRQTVHIGRSRDRHGRERVSRGPAEAAGARQAGGQGRRDNTAVTGAGASPSRMAEAIRQADQCRRGRGYRYARR